MKVIVAGATGFIGRNLVKALQGRGDRVIALTRNAAAGRERLGPDVEVLEWDLASSGSWPEAFSRADAVVNLVGEPIAANRPTQVLSKRWTPAQKNRILSSRVQSTQRIVDAIRQAEPRPAVLVNQSAIGYYGSSGDRILTEQSPAGLGFESQVSVDWEAAARPIESLGVRLVLLRTGIVLDGQGGALPLMVMPFRFFAGGTMGDPRQWFSWIHLEDEIGLILFALDNPDVAGVVNATAPRPVTMETFSRQIGEVVGRPAWVPFIGKAMKLGLGEQSQAVLSSLRVMPEAALGLGYQFKYSESKQALQDLLAR